MLAAKDLNQPPFPNFKNIGSVDSIRYLAGIFCTFLFKVSKAEPTPRGEGRVAGRKERRRRKRERSHD